MNDTELYHQLLGLVAPWNVTEVKVDLSDQSVRVRVEPDRKIPLECPECRKPSPIYDGGEERTWRHLDTCGFETWLVAKAWRVNCPEHGVGTVVVPWSHPFSRWTLAFETFAILVLQNTQCQAKAARLLQLSPDQVHDLMGRAVERGLSRRNSKEPVPHVTIDETSSGHGPHYLTIVGDGERAIEVVEEHTQVAAEAALSSALSDDQRTGVETVTMDMWPAFEAAQEEILPEAERVYDRFHIAANLNKAVDQTRRSEHKRLSQEGNPSLKGTKYLWLYGPEELNEKQKLQLEDLCEQPLETVKVWSAKEAFRSFFECPTVKEGQAFFDHWYKAAKALGNAALDAVAEQFRTHLDCELAKRVKSPTFAIRSPMPELRDSTVGSRLSMTTLAASETPPASVPPSSSFSVNSTFSHTLVDSA
jgi:transposase